MMNGGQFGESEAPTGDGSKHPPNNFLHLQSVLSSSCLPVTLTFVDLCYRMKIEYNSKKRCTVGKLFDGITGMVDLRESTATVLQDRVVLDGITGMVSPGEILAVLGPSGSGKSTLLNVLAGRLHGGKCLTGSVLANGRRLTKPAIKRTGFVPQDDVLYPHLTVRETLVFCSLLRLPESLSKEEKVAVAESVMEELGLGKCGDTMVGNALVRGVSGGERKRVSIGHEMLTNPSLLILDEPTSGLDSTSAHRIMTTLRTMAGKGRTVVTSVHQPSSRVYHMFDRVLVLSEGRSVYFGKGSDAISYFQLSVGLSPAFPMNPADFLLDLANGVCNHDVVIDQTERKQLLVSSYNRLLAPSVKAACIESNSAATSKATAIGKSTGNALIRERSSSNCCSTWFNQFSILLQRGIMEKRHETFNTLRVFQVVAASVLAGSMWWRSDPEGVQDRLGLLFFFSIFWGVFPSFNAAFTFSQDRAIFAKERASGMYTLSPYFVARIVGDMPMELALPTIFVTIAYWMVGLSPRVGDFVLTLLVVLGYVLVSQGLGLSVGALIMDAKQASTVVTVVMLAFVLTGGFYVHNMPPCLAWIKYVSTTFYSYRLLIDVQYGKGKEVSGLLGCSHTYSNVRGPVIMDLRSGVRAGCKFIEEDLQGQINPGLSFGMLVVMFVGYRVLAYIALRRN